MPSAWFAFVYYHRDGTDDDALVAQVQAMQQSDALKAHRGALYRANAGAGRVTWMETYEDASAEFCERLQAEAMQRGLPEPRHVERFERIGDGH